MSNVSCSSLLSLIDETDHHQSSQPSVSSSSDEDLKDICRICHSEGQTDSPLISPCYCSGSLCYVHNSCLQEWIKSSGTDCCEICKFQFIIETKFLPFWKWKKLEMTFVEKLQFVVSFIIHAMKILTLVCLILKAVKIDADERRLLHGVVIFNWTLKIIIGIGMFIEILFMVYQCKLYMQLFHKWRICNRIIYVQNFLKIVGMVQQQQQHTDEFSAFSQLNRNELTRADSNFFSPEESKFCNCQSDSNIRSSNRYHVKFCDEKNPSGEIAKTKMSSNETSLTSDYHLSLSKVVVVSNAADENPKTIADAFRATEDDSRKTSLIAATDNLLVPVANHKCQINEFVEISTYRKPVKWKLKENICHFFSGSHSKTHAEDRDFLLAQGGHS